MSTSTNLPINSLGSCGQSGAATPAPTQPTPTHAAGTQPTSFQFPAPLVQPKQDEVLQKAIQEYVKQLSDDDKAAFQSAPDILEHLQEMQRNGKSLISSSLTARVEKVLQCVKHFMSSLGLFIQHSPQVSSLVVGGVNCILTVSTSSAYLLAFTIHVDLH